MEEVILQQLSTRQLYDLLGKGLDGYVSMEGIDLIENEIDKRNFEQYVLNKNVSDKTPRKDLFSRDTTYPNQSYKPSEALKSSDIRSIPDAPASHTTYSNNKIGQYKGSSGQLRTDQLKQLIRQGATESEIKLGISRLLPADKASLAKQLGIKNLSNVSGDEQIMSQLAKALSGDAYYDNNTVTNRSTPKVNTPNSPVAPVAGLGLASPSMMRMAGLGSALIPNTANAPETSEYEADEWTLPIMASLQNSNKMDFANEGVEEFIKRILPNQLPAQPVQIPREDAGVRTPMGIEDLLKGLQSTPRQSSEVMSQGKSALQDQQEFAKALTGSQQEAESVNRGEFEQALKGSQAEAQSISPKKKSFDEWKQEVKTGLQPKDEYKTPKDITDALSKLTGKRPVETSNDQDRYELPEEILQQAAKIMERIEPSIKARKQADQYKAPAEIANYKPQTPDTSFVNQDMQAQQKQEEQKFHDEMMRNRMMFGDRGNI